eukprot:3893141-Pyramimonas_sp.AAC.1
MPSEESYALRMSHLARLVKGKHKREREVGCGNLFVRQRTRNPSLRPEVIPDQQLFTCARTQLVLLLLPNLRLSTAKNGCDNSNGHGGACLQEAAGVTESADEIRAKIAKLEADKALFQDKLLRASLLKKQQVPRPARASFYELHSQSWSVGYGSIGSGLAVPCNSTSRT